MNLWFKGIRAKLLLLSAIPAFFLIVISIFGISTMERLEEGLRKANFVRGPLITYSGEMLLHSTSISRWTVTSMWNFDDNEERTKALKNAKQSIEDFQKIINIWKFRGLKNRKRFLKTLKRHGPL